MWLWRMGLFTGGGLSLLRCSTVHHLGHSASHHTLEDVRVHQVDERQHHKVNVVGNLSALLQPVLRNLHSAATRAKRLSRRSRLCPSHEVGGALLDLGCHATIHVILLWHVLLRHCHEVHVSSRDVLHVLQGTLFWHLHRLLLLLLHRHHVVHLRHLRLRLLRHSLGHLLLHLRHHLLLHLHVHRDHGHGLVAQGGCHHRKQQHHEDRLHCCFSL